MVKRNKGYIFNLGSIAGSYPYPGGNVYSGVNAFVHRFSLGLLTLFIEINQEIHQEKLPEFQGDKLENLRLIE